MLIQFKVKNFKSFKDETILDMRAINAYKEHEYNLIPYTNKKNLLKVAVIYGANASGKSNLVEAMHCFHSIIKYSFGDRNGIFFSGTGPIYNTGYYPFRFISEDSRENTAFEMVAADHEYEYTYGFEYNDTCIISEWLYRKSLKNNKTSTILERNNDDIQLGYSVREKFKVFKKSIPNETLVLSFCANLNVEDNTFAQVRRLILGIEPMDSNSFDIAFEIGTGLRYRYETHLLMNFIDNDKEKLVSFLSAIDVGIVDITYRQDEDRLNFYTYHKDESGSVYEMNLNEESAGTVKCMRIYYKAYFFIKNGGTMFIDELNVRLHPMLLKAIIDMFNRSDSGAQLIYTTHDLTFLDRKFFRRDQIWFVQKNKNGESELYALSDFKVRSDASFEKDYLAGVYGGIPLIKEFGMEEDGDEKC